MALDINEAYRALWRVLLEPGEVVKSGTYDYTLYDIFIDDFLRFENRHGFVTYADYLASLGFQRPVDGRVDLLENKAQLDLFIETILASLDEVETFNAQIQMNEQFDFGNSIERFEALAAEIIG